MGEDLRPRYISLALRDVAEFVAAQSLSVSVDTVTFTQHFPRYGLRHLIGAFLLTHSRKTFSPSDFTKTLRELGLTPSAVCLCCLLDHRNAKEPSTGAYSFLGRTSSDRRSDLEELDWYPMYNSSVGTIDC